MKLNHGAHLAYCTNVHPGETWAQTFDSLNRWTLAVKERLGNPSPYAIGLRLSDQASRSLSDPKEMARFRAWLDQNNCYVFTINGFPFGQFHGTRVKEQVYAPDWTNDLRLDYTTRLFDILVQLLPPGVEGSVSSLPGSFKEFITNPDQVQRIRDNLWTCVEHVAQLSERHGVALHLGLEPEPLGLFENTVETIGFFETMRAQHPGDARFDQHLGVNYDTCHFAVEFENPDAALDSLVKNGIRISKIHISNALKLRPTVPALDQLAHFADDVYLHQVVARGHDGLLTRIKDLPIALQRHREDAQLRDSEWRVHFHVPLNLEAPAGLEPTSDHVLGLLQFLKSKPGLCLHLEMETYTWAVLPDSLRTRDVSEQIVAEYQWTLARLAEVGFKLAG
jgi:sugar phosphate isomerase/epimerase